MEKNRTGKYLKYAIGEILLVVIGILIALQINNWNEEKKLRKLEISYLSGILYDLKADTTALNQMVYPDFKEKHKKRHNYLDSLVDNNLLSDSTLVSKIAHPSVIANSGISFHPTVGTYNSIISEGNSRIIQDQELFNSIQKLYEVWYKRNNEYSQRRDKIMDGIKTKYAYNFVYESKIENVQNKHLIADLRLMYLYKGDYIGLLGNIDNEIKLIIQKIVAKINPK